MKYDIKNPKDLFKVFTTNQKDLQIECIEYKIKEANGSWNNRYVITLKNLDFTEITIEECGALSIDDMENVVKLNLWVKKLYKFMARNKSVLAEVKQKAYVIVTNALNNASN